MNEFSLIETYFAPLSGEGAFGLSDDAAHLVPPPGRRLVVTVDAVAEGVHYLGSESPDLIAQKLLRRNLSDLAAKGAVPWGYTLSLVLPPRAEEGWIAAFARGLAREQAQFGLTLFGGDTARSLGAASFSATLFGLTPLDEKALLRSGAKEGDLLCVTGTLGDGAMGLRVARGELAHLSNADRDHLLRRYQLPEPRTGFAESLRSCATACLDISDGLAQDAGHLARASGLAAIVRQAALPLSAAARGAIAQLPELAMLPLNGGDDYELLCTLPPHRFSELEAAARAARTSLTVIGRMEAGSGVTVQDEAGNPLPLAITGWQHF